jgi:thioredoxin-related protein
MKLHPILLPALLLFAGFVGSVTVIAAEVRDPGQFFFDQTFGDFSEELNNAREQGKKGVLIMFEMDECPFCHRMKTTVLNQPEIQDYFKENFLIFPVDIEGDVEVTDFAGRGMSQKDLALKEYRVRATPVFAFFDLEGNLVARYTGATRDSAEFLWLGEYVVGGHYRDLPFPKYKRERRESAGG